MRDAQASWNATPSMLVTRSIRLGARDAKLNDHGCPLQVLERKLLHWRAESIERFVDARRIVAVRIDPDVEVFREARLGVDRDGVAANEQVSSARGVQLGKQIAEVLVDRHRDAARPDTPEPCPRPSRATDARESRARTHGRSRVRARAAAALRGARRGGVPEASERQCNIRAISRRSHRDASRFPLIAARLPRFPGRM